MTKDRAGHMPDVTSQIIGREYSDQDKRLVQNVVFYLQEVVKLFPAGTNLSLVGTWMYDGNKRETVNIGTLSNLDVIALLLDVERIRAVEKVGVQGNG